MGNCCESNKGDTGNLDVNAELKPRPLEATVSIATVEPQSERSHAEYSMQDQHAFNDIPNDLTKPEEKKREDTLERPPPSFTLDENDEINSRLSSDIKAVMRLPFDFSVVPSSNVELRGLVKVKEGHYIGEWNGELFEGRGRLYTYDGNLVEGYWRQGKLHGKARCLLRNGDSYEGNFVDGKKEGRGIMKIASSTYEGDWVEDKQTGHGKEKWHDGSSYDGQYFEGFKHGYGLMQWADGSSYEGDFVKNIFDGQGVYKFADKNEYNGYWKAGKMNGRGRFVWASGKVYDGDFIDDLKDGQGQLTLPNGKVYTGRWSKNKRDSGMSKSKKS